MLHNPGRAVARHITKWGVKNMPDEKRSVQGAAGEKLALIDASSSAVNRSVGIIWNKFPILYTISILYR
jgi:hypothetical protein